VTRVVFDTNTVLSGLLWTGIPAQLMDKAFSHTFELLSSELLLAEFETTIRRDKFTKRITEGGETVDALIARYRALVIMVKPIPIERVSRDAKDDMVLECELGGQANYVVSGDKDLLVLESYRDIPICTAGYFLSQLA